MSLLFPLLVVLAPTILFISLHILATIVMLYYFRQWYLDCCGMGM